MSNIAIVTVAYNRSDSLARLLNSLERAYYGQESPTLIISIDKSNTDVVERFADEYSWPHGEKMVRKHEQNLGLRNHMLSLGEWFDKYDALVILEDDIVVSPSFYIYTRQCVNKYSSDANIAGISLYGFEVNYQTQLPFEAFNDGQDVYFMNCAMSWGEVWMKESWRKFYSWYQEHTEFTPSNAIPDRIMEWRPSSWLKYHTRYCIENNLYFVHPYISLTTNYADAGTHNSNATSISMQTNLLRGIKKQFNLPDFNERAVLYDGFFENMKLYERLRLSPDDCCLDLNGSRGNRQKKKYWLTTKEANFKIVKSYGLHYRPMEVNVLEDIEGNEIFLYDTLNQIHKAGVSSRGILYLFHIDYLSAIIKSIGLRNIIKRLWIF